MRQLVSPTETSAWNELSDDAKFIVTHLLTASPAKRLSAWEALQHPWFKSRYHDPTSNRSTLSIAKQAMVRRRSSHHSNKGEQLTKTSGTEGPSAPAGAEEIHAMAKPRRGPSLASFEGMLPATAEDKDDDDLDPATIETRYTGIGDTYAEEGYDEEETRPRGARDSSGRAEGSLGGVPLGAPAATAGIEVTVVK